MRKDKAKHCFALTQGESYARVPVAKYAFIEKHGMEYHVSRMAKLFDVSVSGYYDWLRRDISLRAQHKNRCELLVKSAHLDTKQSYGHERLPTSALKPTRA